MIIPNLSELVSKFIKQRFVRLSKNLTKIMESFEYLLFLGQASTLGYKSNHSLSKGVEKRGGRSHWWEMIINKNKSRMEKLTLFHNPYLEIVNKEKLTQKAKKIHKNFRKKTNTRLSLADLIGPMIGFLALEEKNLRKVFQPLKIR